MDYQEYLMKADLRVNDDGERASGAQRAFEQAALEKAIGEENHDNFLSKFKTGLEGQLALFVIDNNLQTVDPAAVVRRFVEERLEADPANPKNKILRIKKDNKIVSSQQVNFANPEATIAMMAERVLKPVLKIISDL